MTVHVVGGLLVAGHRVLLGHRNPARRWYPDVWDIPGGHVEPGESSRAAVERELREELGVTVSSAHECARLRLPGGAEDDTVVIDVWLVTSWAGTPVNRSPEEHDAVQWFGVDDLPTSELAHPALDGLLRRVLE